MTPRIPTASSAAGLLGSPITPASTCGGGGTPHSEGGYPASEERRGSGDRTSRAAAAATAVFGAAASRVARGRGGARGGAAGAAADGGGAAAAASLWPPGQRVPGGWQPRGVLVAQLRAHPEGVRALALSADGRALLSRGTTSTVKLWRPAHFERELVHAPAAAHALPEGIKAAAVCVAPGDTHAALGTSDGALRLLPFERFAGSSAPAFQLTADDGALLALGATDARGGLLFYATEAGGVHACDARAARPAFRLDHPPRLGLMRTWATDADATSMVVGSHTGHCVLWDLRYALRLRTWQLPTRAPIHTLLYTRAVERRPPVVLVGSADGAISGWEIGESPKATLVLQPEGVSDADAERAAAPAVVGGGSGGGGGGGAPSGGSELDEKSTRALLATADGSLVVSAGADLRVRCWRLGDIARSGVLCGLPAGAPHPAYDERLLPSGCRVVRELPAAAGGVGLGGAPPAERGGVADEGGGAEFRAAITSAVYCGANQPGLLLGGSLDGTVKVWR